MRTAFVAALVALAASGCVTSTTGSPSPVGSGDEPLIHAPADPDAPASTSTAARTFVVTSFDYGALTDSAAWQSLGLDIDDQDTTRDSTDVCQLTAGASRVTQQDGSGGIDNSFGANLLPILITVLGSDAPQRLDASFATGSPGNQLVVFGLSPALDDATVMASFDGAPFAGAWVTGRTVVGGPSAKEARLHLGTLSDGASATAELTFPITHIQVVAPLTADGSTVQAGVLSAIVPTVEAIAAVDTFARAISPGIDEQSLQSIEQQIAQASDILVDGTQDPSRPCDGISLGLGFTAVATPVPAAGSFVRAGSLTRPEDEREPPACFGGGGSHPDDKPLLRLGAACGRRGGRGGGRGHGIGLRRDRDRQSLLLPLRSAGLARRLRLHRGFSLRRGRRGGHLFGCQSERREGADVLGKERAKRLLDGLDERTGARELHRGRRRSGVQARPGRGRRLLRGDASLEDLNDVGGLELLPAESEGAQDCGILRQAVGQLLVRGHLRHSVLAGHDGRLLSERGALGSGRLRHCFPLSP
jgi:hypothetical protein